MLEGGGAIERKPKTDEEDEDEEDDEGMTEEGRCLWYL